MRRSRSSDTGWSGHREKWEGGEREDTRRLHPVYVVSSRTYRKTEDSYFEGVEASRRMGACTWPLYILYWAPWWPQPVSTAPGAPLSLPGQLCSHEAPADLTVEKPKRTKLQVTKQKISWSTFRTLLTPPLGLQSFPFFQMEQLRICVGGFRIRSISPSTSCAKRLVPQTWLVKGALCGPPPVSLQHLS